MTRERHDARSKPRPKPSGGALQRSGGAQPGMQLRRRLGSPGSGVLPAERAGRVRNRRATSVLSFGIRMHRRWRLCRQLLLQRYAVASRTLFIVAVDWKLTRFTRCRPGRLQIARSRIPPGIIPRPTPEPRIRAAVDDSVVSRFILEALGCKWQAG